MIVTQIVNIRISMIKMFSWRLQIVTLIYVLVIVNADYKDESKAKKKQRIAESFFLDLVNPEKRFDFMNSEKGVLVALCASGEKQKLIKYCTKTLATSYFHEDAQAIRLDTDSVKLTCLSRKLVFYHHQQAEQDLFDLLLACPYSKSIQSGANIPMFHSKDKTVKDVVYVSAWRYKEEKGIMLFKNAKPGFFTALKNSVTSGLSATGSNVKHMFSGTSPKKPAEEPTDKTQNKSPPVLQRSKSTSSLPNVSAELPKVMLVTAYRHRGKNRTS